MCVAAVVLLSLQDGESELVRVLAKLRGSNGVKIEYSARVKERDEAGRIASDKEFVGEFASGLGLELTERWGSGDARRTAKYSWDGSKIAIEYNDKLFSLEAPKQFRDRCLVRVAYLGLNIGASNVFLGGGDGGDVVPGDISLERTTSGGGNIKYRLVEKGGVVYNVTLRYDEKPFRLVGRVVTWGQGGQRLELEESYNSFKW